MATTQLDQKLFVDEAFAAVRAFLAERGIDADDEDAIREAIRQRGWEITLEGHTGDWTAKIRERRAATQAQIAIVEDADRTRALLRALSLALSWLTPEQEAEAFDRQARELMAMSGQEFLERWRAGELPADDPRVAHLWLLRPLGW